MKLIKSILTKNPCYSKGRELDNGVQGLMLHSVGCPQPKASVFINNWNRPDFGDACVHGFIDGLTGYAHQTLPWYWRGWHGASGPKGSVNNTHIGIEMCEPDCIKYTSGAIFTCSDLPRARAIATRTYNTAVELFAMLCSLYNLDPLKDGVVISHAEGHKRGIASNHGDPEHLWRGLGMSYTMNGFRRDVKAAMSKEDKSGLQATELANLTEQQVVDKVGPLFTAEQKRTGILASVALAQFILECGYGKTELAQHANNCFGMKKTLSGNTWPNSTWDGASVYTKETQEHDENGKVYTITADFRKYHCVEDSISDHSAYLLGAMNGNKKRYEGLSGEADYTKAIQIIKNGDYATDVNYVDKITSIIKKWKLTKFDVKTTTPEGPGGAVTPTTMYYVQAGAYTNLNNAKALANKLKLAGFSILIKKVDNLYKIQTGAYSNRGNAAMQVTKLKVAGFESFISTDSRGTIISVGNDANVFKPYRVKVDIAELHIRRGPGTNYDKYADYIKPGVFTIVDEVAGEGATKWGLLKAYEDNRDGWISLDYATKLV